MAVLTISVNMQIQILDTNTILRTEHGLTTQNTILITINYEHKRIKGWRPGTTIRFRESMKTAPPPLSACVCKCVGVCERDKEEERMRGGREELTEREEGEEETEIVGSLEDFLILNLSSLRWYSGHPGPVRLLHLSGWCQLVIFPQTQYQNQVSMGAVSQNSPSPLQAHTPVGCAILVLEFLFCGKVYWCW